MSDKELIKQEIERRIKEGSSKNDISEGALALNSLLDFIESLPEEPIVKGITWEDVNTLDTLIDQVRHEFPNGISEKSFGLAVLEKFQDYQDDIEEPASEDLEEEIKSWIPAHIEGEDEYMRKVAIEWSEIVARHFAEWQKQKNLQDFMEKAEMYLKTRVYYNMHPNNVITAIKDFKNYMQDEM